MPINKETFTFGPWTATSVKGHILKSADRERLEAELGLPFPEMVFADNVLQFEHNRGFGVRFLALEALRLVDSKRHTLKVADADVWQRTRSSLEGINNVVKPFDWTYTNDYRGSLYHNLGSQPISVEVTDDRIELEKLKEQEKIFFFDDVTLFEDELADNGSAVMNVKVRVMASGFFILLRFFLRVDGVLARLHETRIYHQAGSESMLREFTKREGSFAKMRVPHSALTDPSKLSSHLTLNETCRDKLMFPKKD